MNGKGSDRRPSQVSAKQLAKNWERTFASGKAWPGYYDEARAPGPDGYAAMIRETRTALAWTKRHKDTGRLCAKLDCDRRHEELPVVSR